MRLRSGRASKFLCLAVLGGSLAGCASQQGAAPTPAEADIRAQIERNWNLAAGDPECPIEEREPVVVRVHLDGDGTVTKVDPITDVSKDKCLLRTYEGASRAVMISSPLKLPPGKTYPIIDMRFSPADIVM